VIRRRVYRDGGRRSSRAAIVTVSPGMAFFLSQAFAFVPADSIRTRHRVSP
jgi:hypothetical protein